MKKKCSVLGERKQPSLSKCKTWQEVLAAGQFVTCLNCGKEQKVRGGLYGKKCRRCFQFLSKSVV